MVAYKNAQILALSNDPVFDALHPPGTRVQRAGIYCCEACGRNITHNVSDPLPPQNHHQHPNAAPIRWKLVVAA